VDGDTLYVGTFDNSLYALNAADGKEKWRVEAANWFWAAPLVADGIVYAASLDKRVYAYDASSGRELWRFDSVSPIPSRPVYVSGLLVGVSDTGEIFILDAKTGNLKNTINLESPVIAPLFVEDNTVYVHAKSRHVYAVDVQAGQIAWKFSLDVESK
jgi:outer membrane protein assembly factor BamB